MQPEQKYDQVPQPPAPAEQTPKANQPVGAFSLLGKSMHTWGVNIGTFILVGLLLLIPFVLLGILVAINSVGNTASGSSTETSPHLSTTNIALIVIGIIATLILVVIVSAASYKIQLESARNKKIGFKEAMAYGRNYGPRLLGLGILAGLIILLGFIVLIIPGLFMLKRYYLAPFYLIDKDLGIREAMSQSAADAKTYSGAIWGILGVYFLYGLIGVLPFIGIAGSILQLLYTFAPALRYVEIQTLKGDTHTEPHHPITDPMPQTA